MKNNRLVVKINKPSSEVFAFYIDPENTPLWVDSIIAEQTNEWPIKIGTVLGTRTNSESGQNTQ